MKRRFFLLTAAGALVWTFHARAQHAGKLPRVGLLAASTARSYGPFVDGLRKLGYIDGTTMRLETRWPPAQDRVNLDRFAKELVALKVDVLATVGSPATEAAIAATRTVPIVMVAVGDPVGSGFVQSLARPGGNVTGVSVFAVDLAAKQLQLLQELVPKLTRVAVLWNPGNATHRPFLERFEAAAKRMRVTRLAMSRPEELDTALAPLADSRFDAMFVPTEAMFATERQRIVGAIAQAQVPALFGDRLFVDAGGLASYGADLAHTARRAAAIAASILKGARPQDIPVEEPTKFDLVINTLAAKKLNLRISASILMRADEVVERP